MIKSFSTLADIKFTDNIDWQGERPQTPLYQSLVVNIVDNAQTYSSPATNSVRLRLNLEFGEKLTPYKKSSDNRFWLIQNKEKHWGWVAVDNVLDREIALKSGQFNQRTQCIETYTQADCKTPLHKDNFKSFAKALMAANRVDLYAGPNTEKYPIIRQLPSNVLNYIYKVQAVDNVIWLLLGAEEYVNYDIASFGLHGWVKWQDVIVWTNKIAVWFNEDNRADRKPVSFHLKELHAIQNNKKNAIAVEYKAESLTFDMNRFPLLTGSLNDDVINVGLSVGLPKSLNQSTITRASQHLETIINKLSNRNVMFLIDGTNSLHGYIGEIKRALSSFIDTLPQATIKKYKFGLAIYRDLFNGEHAFEIIQQFESDISNAALRRIRLIGNNDIPEALFNGIISATEEIDWPEGMRSILLIGDHGNYPPSHKFRRYSEDKVANTLKENAVVLSAIHLDSGLQESKLFSQQVNAVINLSGNWGDLNTVRISQQEKKSDKRKVRSYILKALRQNEKNSASFASNVTAAITARTKLASKVTTGIELRTKALIDQIDASKAIDMLKNDLYATTSLDVWSQSVDLNGYQNFKPWVLLARFQLDEMLGFLVSLNQQLKRKLRKNAPAAISVIFSNLIGDDIAQGMEISSVLAQYFGIEKEYWSSIFHHTPERFAEKLTTSPAFYLSVRKLLCEKTGQLRAVSSGEEATMTYNLDKKTDAFECKYRLVGAKRWFFSTLGGQQEYLWLPLQYLP